MTHEKLVSKVVRGITDEAFAARIWPIPFIDKIARAAIAAVYEALKEPTPEMLQASADAPVDLFADDELGQMTRAEWRAMLAASPLVPGEDK